LATADDDDGDSVTGNDGDGNGATGNDDDGDGATGDNNDGDGMTGNGVTGATTMGTRQSTRGGRWKEGVEGDKHVMELGGGG